MKIGRWMEASARDLRWLKLRIRRNRLRALRDAKQKRRAIYISRVSISGECRVLCYAPNDTFDGLTISMVFDPIQVGSIPSVGK